VSCPRLRFRNISAHDHLPDFFLICTERAARVGPCVFRIVEAARCSLVCSAQCREPAAAIAAKKTGINSRTSLKVRTGAQCGKILVQETLRGASHLAHPAVYCGHMQLHGEPPVVHHSVTKSYHWCYRGPRRARQRAWICAPQSRKSRKNATIEQPQVIDLVVREGLEPSTSAL